MHINTLISKSFKVITDLLTAQRTISVGSDGTEADVIATNGNDGLVVVSPAHISEENSSSTPLLANATFTGEWEDITNNGIFIVTVNASHVSAIDGLCICFSTDGVNTDSTDEFTIPANTGKTFSFQAATRYFKLTYVNGGSDQTHFRIQTILKPYYVKPSSHRISDSLSGEDDAELVKAIISGKNPSGNYINFEATTGGNFKTSLEELESGVSVNSNSQLKVTQYDSTGTEGQNIIGVKYKSGNDGIDPSTNGLICISHAENSIHDGDHFYVAGFETLGTDAAIEICFLTPDSTTEIHHSFAVSGTSQTEFKIFESATCDTDGTTVTPINNNRISTNTSAVSLEKNPTVTDYGTLIFATSAGLAGSNPSSADNAGTVGIDHGLVLKRNTSYVFQITSRDAGNIVSFHGLWDEHVPKN